MHTYRPCREAKIKNQVFRENLNTVAVETTIQPGQLRTEKCKEERGK